MKKVVMRWMLVWVVAMLAMPAVRAAEQEQPTIRALNPVPQTRGWWTDRHRQKLEDVKNKQGDVDLVMIGDSITHGWEIAGLPVWDKYYKARKALNLGYSSDRTEHVLWRLQSGEFDGISPKLAILMIGTNNSGQCNDPADHTVQGIKAILDDLRKRLPKTKILLLAIFPREEKPDGHLRKLNDQINESIAGFADNKTVFFLDINQKFLDENGVLSRSIMGDLLHPGLKGYEIWAEAMEPMVQKLMGEKVPAAGE